MRAFACVPVYDARALVHGGLIGGRSSDASLETAPGVGGSGFSSMLNSMLDSMLNRMRTSMVNSMVDSILEQSVDHSVNRSGVTLFGGSKALRNRNPSQVLSTEPSAHVTNSDFLIGLGSAERAKRDVGFCDSGFVVGNGPQPWPWPLTF